MKNELWEGIPLTLNHNNHLIQQIIVSNRFLIQLCDRHNHSLLVSMYVLIYKSKSKIHVNS